MLVSYKWLREYIDIDDISPLELAEKLTRAGVEVEAVHQRGEGIQNVVVGYVEEHGKHPNADTLRICQVDIGESEPVQIVCGAANVGQGQKVAVAKVGAVLPGNFKIKKAKLRGEESQGMICSATELGIDERLISTEDKEGILVLPEDLPVGSSALSHLDLDDSILELELTPNRSDCLSMLGVAYEVGAILDRDIQLPSLQVEESEEAISEQVKVKIESDLCGHYAARKVKNVAVGSSPLWLQNRLIAAGVRPINNVVDVTNYVMLEYGQPLHAFDASKVKDEHIIVRQAKSGERVMTLDGQERHLEEGMLMITDPEKIISVAGVMGAANTEVSAETTEIIIESAYFEDATVRHTSKTLGLRSEASVRFEKKVDPKRVEDAATRTAQLLAQLASGTVVQGIAEDRFKSYPPREVSLNMIHLNNVLGTNLTNHDVSLLFERLKFDYENKGHELMVEVPTRRPDITIEEDLIEEVARMYGYDEIPTTLPAGVTTPGSRTTRQKLRRTIKHFLQGAGMDQVITYSLTSQENASWENGLDKNIHPIALLSPMSDERTHLRTTMIPNLLEVVAYNQNRQQKKTHIFEIGHVFLTREQDVRELPQEKEMIAGVLSGWWQSHPWQHSQVQVDFFVVKGVIEGLLDKLEIKGIQVEPASLDGYHPGRAAWIKHGEKRIGYLGQIHPQVAAERDIEAVYAFELSIDHILEHLPGEITYHSLPKYPSIERDLAIVVNEQVTADQLTQTIQEAGAPLLASVRLFDVYEGERIGNNRKSMAFSLMYQDPEKTLTDDEVSHVHEQLIEALRIKWQAELRK